MKKRILGLAAAFSLICVLSGCEKKEVQTAENYNWNIESVPEYMTEPLADNIQIDAKVRILSGFEDGKADIMHVCEKEIDMDKVFQKLGKGKAVTEQNVEHYEDGDIKDYLFSDNARLFAAKNYFHYQTELSEYLYYCLRLGQGMPESNHKRYKEITEDFDYMSMEDAENVCYELLTDMGIAVHPDAWEAYRLPHDVLQEEEEVLVMEQMPPETQPKPKPEWTEEDDSYYFAFYPTIEGNGMIPDTYVSGSEALRGFQAVTVIYNSAGVVQAHTDDAGFKVTDIIEKDVSLMNYETVIENIYERYKNVITDTMMTATDITLGYVLLREETENQYTAMPAWSVSIVYEDPQMETTYSEEILFNAVTGEEIY